MAHFYGTLQGARGEATRGGSKQSGIETYTASWEGAVNVRLWYDKDANADMAEVSLVKWHGRGASHVLYHGPVGPLNGLKVLDEKDGRAVPSLRACEFLGDGAVFDSGWQEAPQASTEEAPAIEEGAPSPSPYHCLQCRRYFDIFAEFRAHCDAHERGVR